MHAARIARHAQLGVPSPGPVDLQPVFGRLFLCPDLDLLDHRSQQALLELDRRLARVSRVKYQLVAIFAIFPS